jgi:mono/diheme cytochrome c family protein
VHKGTFRTAALSIGALLLLIVVIGLIVIYSGAYNVAATAGHTGLTSWILDTAQHNSVAARAESVSAPPELDQAAIQHGFEHFNAMCVVCHGAPGVERGEFGQGITPTPPELSDEATEWSTRELFWITKHGIKFAGMPAFGPTHSDQEIWAIAEFVTRLPEMTPAQYQQLVDQLAPSASQGSAPTPGHQHAPGTPAHSH